MARYTPETWTTLFDRKEEALQDAKCFDALEVSSFDQLQASLYSMSETYGHHGFPDIVNKLSPGLGYLQSFHSAINSASQYDPRACLVWGIMQAVVQVNQA